MNNKRSIADDSIDYKANVKSFGFYRPNSILIGMSKAFDLFGGSLSLSSQQVRKKSLMQNRNLRQLSQKYKVLPTDINSQIARDINVSNGDIQTVISKLKPKLLTYARKSRRKFKTIERNKIFR